jgi:hypothetical protein
MAENQQKVTVPKRILRTLLTSLTAGVVPRSGAPYIAIGRRAESAALLDSLDAAGEGGSSLRFLIGRYGSGKSFLLQLLRGYALDRDFLTADADLSPERRLYGSGGTGRATYRELIKNLASKSSPDGGALTKIIARWIDGISGELMTEGIEPDSPGFSARLNAIVIERLANVRDLVGGFDFSRVVTEYYKAYKNGDDERLAACMRWLRGEFAGKTEARGALGFSVSVVVDDDNWYDFLKLWAVFVRSMGYRGLVLFIDECVNLYKINHRVSRENNYEKILSMFNDTLQGRAEGLGIVFGGTPQFLEDTRRGLFSYEALRSRLCDSRFSLSGYKNLIGPVIRLRRLGDDELFALITRITNLYAQNYGTEPKISEEDKVKFLEICLSRAGADSMITPREMLRDYMTVLNILMQNENVVFDDIVGSAVTLKTESDEDEEIEESVSEAAPADTQKKLYTPQDIEF